MKYFVFNSVVFFLLMLFISCGNSEIKKTEVQFPGPVVSGTVNPAFNETSRLIAGIDLKFPSKLAQVADSDEYKKYRAMIDNSWNGFITENMKKISDWSRLNIKKPYSRFVFYPFSGPDALHPLLFYPDAEDIIMFGLEPIGEIPDTAGMTQAEILNALRGLPEILNFTLKHAFFVTLDMQKKVGKNQFSGITGIMMFFLSRGGYDVLQIKKIFINKEGGISSDRDVSDKSEVSGVEITFKKHGVDLKRIRFFQLDISDRSPRLPRFVNYCGRYPGFSTIIKSASYLMHNKDFTVIRDFILGHSYSIIQDDSGVPFSALADGSWRLTFHGRYHHPLTVFSTYNQPELNKAVKKYSAGDLPFTYGYGYGFDDITYHLVHAERFPSFVFSRDKFFVHIGTPVPAAPAGLYPPR